MGICASCLGSNRHSSQQKTNESAPLLDEARPTRYGAVTQDEQTQPDEEELQRERDMLSQITNQATEGMIDVVHGEAFDIGTHMTPTHTLRNPPDGLKKDRRDTDCGKGIDEADEQAWLDSIENLESETVTQIKPLHTGGLVWDITQLREQAPPPSARKLSKMAAGRM